MKNMMINHDIHEPKCIHNHIDFHKIIQTYTLPDKLTYIFCYDMITVQQLI